MSETVSSKCTQDPFTPVPNYIISDPVMSLEAKMTWILLFSKRHIPNWQVHPWHIQKSLGFGNHVWRRVSKELHAEGYFRSVKKQTGTEITFVWDWDMKVGSFKPALHSVDKVVDKV